VGSVEAMKRVLLYLSISHVSLRTSRTALPQRAGGLHARTTFMMSVVQLGTGCLYADVAKHAGLPITTMDILNAYYKCTLSAVTQTFPGTC
jgi:hypothetical protein